MKKYVVGTLLTLSLTVWVSCQKESFKTNKNASSVQTIEASQGIDIAEQIAHSVVLGFTTYEDLSSSEKSLLANTLSDGTLSEAAKYNLLSVYPMIQAHLDASVDFHHDVTTYSVFLGDATNVNDVYDDFVTITDPNEDPDFEIVRKKVKPANFLTFMNCCSAMLDAVAYDPGGTITAAVTDGCRDTHIDSTAIRVMIDFSWLFLFLEVAHKLLRHRHDDDGMWLLHRSAFLRNGAEWGATPPVSLVSHNFF